MNARVWRLAGVSLLCVSVTTQALAEGQSDELRGAPHGGGQEHGQGRPQGGGNQQPQQRPQAQPQPQQRPQAQPQPQQQQQRPQVENRQGGWQGRHDDNRHDDNRGQWQRPAEQVQNRPPQNELRGSDRPGSQQWQRPQPEPQQRPQSQPQVTQSPLRDRPSEVRQSQPPRPGFYDDITHRNSRPDDHRWSGRPDGRGNGWGDGPRYRPGQYVNRFDGRNDRIPYRGGDYFYSGGYWYRPDGPRYVVVTPPRGIRTHWLPDYSREVWIGGALFFLAAGTYYQYMSDSQDYVVVDPPQAQPVAVQPASNPYDVLAYPMYGQSAEQVQQDRYDCWQWAIQQTQFDPSASAYAPADYVVSNFRNALGGCLAGRGYQVNY